MKKLTFTLILFPLFWLMDVNARPSESNAAPARLPTPGELSVRAVRYDGRLSEEEARFDVDLEVEAAGSGGSTASLFEGDVALLPEKMPDSLKIVRAGNRYVLAASRPGRYSFKLQLVAKIQRAEPWNEVSFIGPAATIASLAAQAAGPDVEVQLLNGTLLTAEKTNGVSRIKAFLGAQPAVALRWQGKLSEVTRQALLTVDTAIEAQVTPTVLKYTSRFHYEIVQGSAAQLVLSLPAAQALTRLLGDQIRDWRTVMDGDRQVLTIEFIKPLEKAYDLVLHSEQALEGNAAGKTELAVRPPQPVGVERESGGVTLSAEDMNLEVGSVTGLRQVNATAGALAAYRFNGRPFTLSLRLERIEPVTAAADRVSARLEESRLLVSHALNLTVEKAGLYSVEFLPQSGFTVAEVRGEGIEDWKAADGKLRVNFSARVLGSRRVEVQLEQALKTFPPRIQLQPLRLIGATTESAQIGAGSAPGIQIKPAEFGGLREIPVRLWRSGSGGPEPATPASASNDTVVSGADEWLAFTAEQPNWTLSLECERLSARIVADVFNLVTIGDGVVGGSATIRYGLLNQGVQEFKVRVPAHCRNVEFTGPNIRRKEVSRPAELAGVGGGASTNDAIWTIGLQDKVWGAYTLVVTYDFPFDPRGATLRIGGVHPLETERETGSVAITTAASLQLNAGSVGDMLRRVDESELAAADRGLITRAVVLAYQYSGDDYSLAVDAKHYEPGRVLEAVADRTQITSVLTEAGEMLTQASFMVKNNEKQFQRFLLPPAARLWGCYVNGKAAKPERDGDWVLVSLPRDENRDQAFAVDIMYAEKKASLTAHWTQALELSAPRTDVPNTYAEWQLFVPPSMRLSHFGGSMMVAQGTTYELLDAWEKFIRFYFQVLHEAGGAILVIGILALFVIALVISAVRRGWSGVVTLFLVLVVLAVLGAMLLPALASAKRKAQRIQSVNNLKQIGVAVRLYSGDNDDRLPASFEDMKNELGTDKITYDPNTGQRYTYLGGHVSPANPDAVLAYSPIVNGSCAVLYVDGAVEQVRAEEFALLAQNNFVRPSASTQLTFSRGQGLPPAHEGRGLNLPATSPASLAEMPAASEGLALAPSQAVTAIPTEPAALSPAVAGIHSIRIELPQTGQPFLFTKVLNIRDEPLSIRARLMSMRSFQNLQMAWQVAAFLLGLGAWAWQWKRAVHRSSFVLTAALALMMGSVASLLIQWRALHDALIIGFPVALVAILAYLIWRYWPRTAETTPAQPPRLGSSPPAVAASILIAAALGARWMTGAAHAAVPVQGGGVSILSARYSGTVNDRVALVDAELTFSSGATRPSVPLFGEEVALRQFRVKRGDAKLVREGNTLAVRLGGRGEVVIEVEMLVKVTGDVTKRRLLFGLPPALSSEVALALDQPEADVEFPTAVSFQRELEKDKTRVTAVIGSADRVEVLWTPRVKRAAEVAATIFCKNRSTVTFGGGVAAVRTRLEYQVTQGELRQARVRLPADQRLLRVEGVSIRNWQLTNDSGGTVLVVELLKGISPEWVLTLETEKALENLPASAAVELPHALEVKRETGLVGLRGAEEMGLSVESTADVQRVDVEEFARATGEKGDGLTSVFQFMKPEFGLRVRVETLQPQIEALVLNRVRAGLDQVRLSASIQYTIKRTGLFVLRLALPEGYRTEQVLGTHILQWTEFGPGGAQSAGGISTRARTLEVKLKERTSGGYQLNLELVRSLGEMPRSMAIVGVHPLEAAKLTGYIALLTEPGLAAKTESFDGLSEIPSVSLPESAGFGGAGNVLAYKFISGEKGTAPTWKLSVATETVDAWVRAETVNTLSLAENLVSGRAQVRYDIANAPVKELRLAVPASFRNVEISGANIRSKEALHDRPATGTTASEPGMVEWRVELQNKIRGICLLTVTWEQPRPARSTRVEISGVSASGVERETGLICVAPKPGVQVRELSAVDLQRVDRGEWPDWAGRPDEAAALTYHYVRAGARLVVEARRFDEAEVLQTLVDNARFTTVVADDGQTMTAMTLSVRNNGRQFLELGLPASAAVWSAFVAGQPVRPSLRNGKLLLPIAQSGGDEDSLTIELTYVATNVFPGVHGPVAFDSPTFDVPLKNAQWELYLPPEYHYSDLPGTMTREVSSQPASSWSFSLVDYTRMERASKASAKADVKRDVSYAERNLSGGNVREAAASFNRAKASAAYSLDDAAGVKELEKKLSSAQASNLIAAQTEFAIRNNTAGGQLISPNQANLQGVGYDNSSAELQWAKLQQAQEILAAKVQPLHVNLPLRGQRHAFNQVLQTQAGKPMTIRLLADSTRAVSWPRRVAAGMAGFAVLWLLVSFGLRLGQRRMATV